LVQASLKRVLHNVLALGIIAPALVHGWYSGGDLQNVPMRILWVVMGSTATAAGFVDDLADWGSVRVIDQHR